MAVAVALCRGLVTSTSGHGQGVCLHRIFAFFVSCVYRTTRDSVDNNHLFTSCTILIFAPCKYLSCGAALTLVGKVSYTKIVLFAFRLGGARILPSSKSDDMMWGVLPVNVLATKTFLGEKKRTTVWGRRDSLHECVETTILFRSELSSQTAAAFEARRLPPFHSFVHHVRMCSLAIYCFHTPARMNTLKPLVWGPSALLFVANPIILKFRRHIRRAPSDGSRG